MFANLINNKIYYFKDMPADQILPDDAVEAAHFGIRPVRYCLLESLRGSSRAQTIIRNSNLRSIIELNQVPNSELLFLRFSTPKDRNDYVLSYLQGYTFKGYR